jgi:hypothetical protein
LQRWQQSEKPVLKELAAGMKETMQVLAKEEAALRRRVNGFAAGSVPNHPGTSTGFNVIRSRVDALGQPLSTDALRAERARLLKTVDVLEVQIASAKAEIMQHRRHEELDIWETKLVALQASFPRPTSPPRHKLCRRQRALFCAVDTARCPWPCAGHQARLPRRDQFDRGGAAGA